MTTKTLFVCRKKRLNHFKVYKKTICIIFYLLVSNPFCLLSQSSIQDLYKQYEGSRQACGTCMQTSTGHEIEEYSKKLNAIAGELPDKNASFLEKALKIIIYKDMLHISSVKCGVAPQANNFLALKKRIASLLELEKRLNDKEKAFSDYTTEINGIKGKKSVPIKEILFGGIAFESNFEIVWDVLKGQTDSIVLKKEEQIYTGIAPDKSFSQLDSFINYFCVYNPENTLYSHYARDAFESLYQIFTADGESSSFDEFKKFVNYRNGPPHQTSIWKKLLDAAHFQKKMRDDRAVVTKWEDILYDTYSAEENLAQIVEEAAPKEIAFVALQKIIRPYLDTLGYDSAIRKINEYKPYFFKQFSGPSAGWKVEKLIKIISTHKKQPQWNIFPVIGTESHDLYFFLDKNKEYLGVMPVGDDDIKIYKTNTNSKSFQESSQFLDIVPYSYVYWFENKGSTSTGVVEAQDQGLYKINKDSIENAADFFVSKDGKILLFVGISKSPRYDRLNGQVYQYPGSGVFFKQFQEFEHKDRFHGKSVGNPNTDIFICTKSSAGWSLPQLIRGNVNTPFSERSPVLSDDNRTLYFSSEGHPGIGGFDVFSIRLNNTLEAENDPEHISFVCPAAASIDDDLFYNPFKKSKIPTVLFSSNRGGSDFNIFQVSKESPPPPPPPPPPLDSTVNLNGLHLTIECVDGKKKFPGLEDGYVIVSGKVLDESYKPVESASVTFYAHDENPIEDRNDDGANYSCWVPYGPKKFKVMVSGFAKNGQIITHIGEEFIEVCNNDRKTVNGKKDFIATKINDEELKGREMRLPIFFGSNKHASTISDEQMLINYYSTLKNNYKGRKMKLICYGFADMVGSADYNKKLSEQRAEYVKQFLITKVGIDGNQIQALGVGKTNAYDADDFEKHLEELTFSVDKLSKYQRNLLLNRRVSIRIVDKFK